MNEINPIKDLQVFREAKKNNWIPATEKTALQEQELIKRVEEYKKKHNRQHVVGISKCSFQFLNGKTTLTRELKSIINQGCHIDSVVEQKGFFVVVFTDMEQSEQVE